MAVKYFTDESKRRCICLISITKKYNDGKSYTKNFKGVAKCSPDDEFKPETGLELAHLRALIKFKTWEKANHQANIDFCKKAVEYYSGQNIKLEEKYQKTIDTLERLNTEYSELIEEL